MKEKLMWVVCHCRIDCNGNATVGYYAYDETKPMYGLHLIDDMNDPSVIWYDNAASARANILNSEDEFITSKYRMLEDEQYGVYQRCRLHQENTCYAW